MAHPDRSKVRGDAGKSTRKMQATRMAMALIILVIMALAIFLYSRNAKSVLSLGLPVVLAITVLFLVGMRVLEAKGKESIKRAKQAERGAIAEENTGSLLEGMPQGYFVVHDLDTGKGNIDHVLICHKGIFTIEVKSHRGEVTFDGSNLLLSGKPFEKDFLKQAWAECNAVREILAKWRIDTPTVEPLIVFSNAFVTVRGKAKGIEVMNLKYLLQFLKRLPDRWNTGEAGRIFNRMKGTA